MAIGGRRLNINHGTCSKNTVNLTLTRMKQATPTPDTADFEFDGALSFGPFPTGDKNAVIVDVLAGTTPQIVSFTSTSTVRASGPGTNSFLGARLPRYKTLTLVKEPISERNQLAGAQSRSQGPRPG
jgi:hypothetical protein